MTDFARKVGVRLLLPALLIATADATAAETVRLALRDRLAHAPWHIAAERGYFERESIDVELVSASPEDDLYDLFDGGEIEFAALTSHEILDYRDAGLDLGGALILGTSLGAEALVGRGELRDARALRGRRIGVTRGSSGELLLNYLLQRKGLSADRVELVSLSPDRTADAVISGDVDAAMVRAPYLHRARDAEGVRVVADASEEPGLIVDLLAADADYVEDNRPLVMQLIRAWNDAVNYLGRSPERAYAIVAESMDLPPDVIADSMAGIEFHTVDDNMELLRGEFQKAFDAMGEALAGDDDGGTSFPSANGILVLSPLRQVAARR